MLAHIKKIYLVLINYSELFLFVILVLIGNHIINCNPWGIEKDSAASLAGALFGGAAVLLGNVINRLNDRLKQSQTKTKQIENLKALIACELIDVALKLIHAKEFIDKAYNNFKNGHQAVTGFDLNRYKPPQMPFTMSLGTKLLDLETEAIDAIMILKSNLGSTINLMDKITDQNRYGLLEADNLSKSLENDMGILSTAFKHIAPDRKFKLKNGDLQLVIDILNRTATSGINSQHLF